MCVVTAPDAHSACMHTEHTSLGYMCRSILLILEKKTEAINVYYLNNNKGEGQKGETEKKKVSLIQAVGEAGVTEWV